MKVALIQYQCAVGMKDINLMLIEEMLIEAGEKGAEMVVLPELWNVGYDLENIAEHAEDTSGPSLALLREYAKKYSMVVVGGSIMERKGDKYYNTCFVFGKNGEIISKYRKAHLYTHGFEESKYFENGDELVLFEVDGVKIGMMICYDMWFPAFARNLALRGAEMLLLPGQWPFKRIKTMHSFCVARAMENYCNMLACNNYGSSIAVAANGEIIATAGQEPEVLIVDVDTDLPKKIKGFNNTMEDRRPFLDEIDSNVL